jgi:hypothetical protein
MSTSRYTVVPNVKKEYEFLHFQDWIPWTWNEYSVPEATLRIATSILLLALLAGHASAPPFPSHTRLNHVQTTSVTWLVTLGMAGTAKLTMGIRNFNVRRSQVRRTRLFWTSPLYTYTHSFPHSHPTSFYLPLFKSAAIKTVLSRKYCG